MDSVQSGLDAVGLTSSDKGATSLSSVVGAIGHALVSTAHTVYSLTTTLASELSGWNDAKSAMDNWNKGNYLMAAWDVANAVPWGKFLKAGKILQFAKKTGSFGGKTAGKKITTKQKELAKDINIDKKLQSNFSGIGIVSSKPLVIAFNVTESIYAYIWYAETADSVEYIFSYPQVVANELTVKKLDEHWFYMRRDWN